MNDLFLRWKAEIVMIYVCKEHLIKGIHSIQVPHIEEISSTKCVCEFCGQEVNYRLFIPMLKKRMLQEVNEQP